jgi:hypothetical protein
MDLLIIYTHNSELQAVTAPSLIYTLYKSPQHMLSLFSACCVFTIRSLATALTVEILQLHALRSSLHRLAYRILYQLRTNLVGPFVFKITPRHGPHRKHRYFIVACVFVAAGTWLPSCCPETGCITPFIMNSLPPQWRRFVTVTQQQVYMLQH